ncbi:hypothetical protein M406DRAFT_269825 [Cryphonectria parasitica EP155]|uniref:SnoaL-like domain-containing protein n=1 Tax=Cryphonectria parasitica (strain ATCC 38755 / EP155) TaxID=660469 RepID=A0A9P4XQM5_CRYP1|nr:uncharacterized protein M406DRAFT_269825 [Cryphonectria parasitica EP155]KAF3760029.1 hypothetical protein M406DRAFT_269825 [Cryphonectria parasitica EP155]
MATQTPPVRAQGVTGGAGGTPSFSSLGIKNTNINTAPGVQLTEQHKVLVGSVLDLFEGNPTLKHFSVWSQDATFTDPLTVATGYHKYAAQFYGLPALFKPIELQNHQVTSAGNPIELEMSNKYVVKGIKKEQVINSIVRIHVGSDGKIDKVEDRWNGNLPDGAISDAFRKLNAVTVPTFVKVPKTEEEDMKMKAERE